MSMVETMGLEIDGLAYTLSRLNGIRDEKNAPYFDEKAAQFIIETVNDCTAVKRKIIDTINAFRPDFFKLTTKEGRESMAVSDFNCVGFDSLFDLILIRDTKMVEFFPSRQEPYYLAYENHSILDGITVADIVRKKPKVTFFRMGAGTLGNVLGNVEKNRILTEIAGYRAKFSPTEWNRLVNIANNTKKETEDILAAFKTMMEEIIRKRSGDIENCENSAKRLADIRYSRILNMGR